jgi:hypothetical protein
VFLCIQKSVAGPGLNKAIKVMYILEIVFATLYSPISFSFLTYWLVSNSLATCFAKLSVASKCAAKTESSESWSPRQVENFQEKELSYFRS